MATKDQSSHLNNIIYLASQVFIAEFSRQSTEKLKLMSDKLQEAYQIHKDVTDNLSLLGLEDSIANIPSINREVEAKAAQSRFDIFQQAEANLNEKRNRLKNYLNNHVLDNEQRDNIETYIESAKTSIHIFDGEQVLLVNVDNFDGFKPDEEDKLCLVKNQNDEYRLYGKKYGRHQHLNLGYSLNSFELSFSGVKTLDQLNLVELEKKPCLFIDEAGAKQFLGYKNGQWQLNKINPEEENFEQSNQLEESLEQSNNWRPITITPEHLYFDTLSEYHSQLELSGLDNVYDNGCAWIATTSNLFHILIELKPDLAKKKPNINLAQAIMDFEVNLTNQFQAINKDFNYKRPITNHFIISFFTHPALSTISPILLIASLLAVSIGTAALTGFLAGVTVALASGLIAGGAIGSVASIASLSCHFFRNPMPEEQAETLEKLDLTNQEKVEYTPVAPG